MKNVNKFIQWILNKHSNIEYFRYYNDDGSDSTNAFEDLPNVQKIGYVLQFLYEIDYVVARNDQGLYLSYIGNLQNCPHQYLTIYVGSFDNLTSVFYENIDSFH